MMIPSDFIKNLMNDIRIDLTEEFDRNFERKAFFDQPWAQRKLKPGNNLMNVHGGQGLRGSIMSKSDTNSVTWSSSLPYASIHNNGGEITVTEKMRKFFWFMYYKSANALVFSTKTKEVRNNQRNKALSTESEYWKALALKKIGDKLTIPKRQYIGTHRNVQNIVKQDADNAVVQLGKELQLQFTKMKK